jgi:hypothetical protein
MQQQQQQQRSRHIRSTLLLLFAPSKLCISLHKGCIQKEVTFEWKREREAPLLRRHVKASILNDTQKVGVACRQQDFRSRSLHLNRVLLALKHVLFHETDASHARVNTLTAARIRCKQKTRSIPVQTRLRSSTSKGSCFRLLIALQGVGQQGQSETDRSQNSDAGRTTRIGHVPQSVVRFFSAQHAASRQRSSKTCC